MPERPPSRWLWNLAGPLYALTVLASALLVFLIQPLVSRAILAWFGGTTAVWSTCMLFFQLLLLAGYAYAHASIRLLRPREQGLLHLVLVMTALALLPLSLDAGWKPRGDELPAPRILGLLFASVGLPFLVLSATAPLIQAWAGRDSLASPYRLYSLSNIGSLVALLGYPLVVERVWTVPQQATLWTLGFAAFALACGSAAWRLWVRSRSSNDSAVLAQPVHHDAGEASNVSSEASSKFTGPLSWLALSFVPSVALLAVTNHISQDVASFPLLWVVPLAIYLATFIACFASGRWYARRFWAPLTAVFCLAAGACGWSYFRTPLVVEVALFLGMLLSLSMLCHGELVARRPEPRRLTAFYLSMSLGGALGGLFVSLLSPLLFQSYLELRLVVIVGYLLGLAWMMTPTPVTVGRPSSPLIRCMLLTAAALVGPLVIGRGLCPPTPGVVIDQARNFYGVLYVDEADAGDDARHCRILRHGRVLHGLQFASPDLRQLPTTYYDSRSGVGLLLGGALPAGPRRVGAVGLGVGTLAAYGRPGDEFRFYEINPDVERMARKHFTFLSASQARVEVVLGDARLQLEHEPPQELDLLALDAFSGDAIPTHLLTREALELYLRHILPTGVIAVHVTNRHLDLEPIVRRLASEFGLQAQRVDAPLDEAQRRFASSWLLLSRDESFFDSPNIRPALSPPRPLARGPLWTDDFHNVLDALR